MFMNIFSDSRTVIDVLEKFYKIQELETCSRTFFAGVHSTRSLCEQVYQLLAQGRWFSLASSTNKAGRHDIA